MSLVFGQPTWIQINTLLNPLSGSYYLDISLCVPQSILPDDVLEGVVLAVVEVGVVEVVEGVPEVDHLVGGTSSDGAGRSTPEQMERVRIFVFF